MWRMAVLFISIIALNFPLEVSGHDPWKRLQEVFSSENVPKEANRENSWVRLRVIYLPFTEKEEISGLTKRATDFKMAAYFHQKLDSYKNIILECARHFNIPVSIIQGVIMVESGGDCYARAKISSAKGLMQTIDSTFQEAREALKNSGIKIKNNPFDPWSSIYAGSWYLDQMYRRVHGNRSLANKGRQNLWNWKKPLEYYYVGPQNGKKRKDIIVIYYSDGTRRKLNKSLYAKKVINWAKILEKMG